MPPRAAARARFALMVAHPGHELRVFGWMLRSRPLVCILTDGSGIATESRIAHSAELVEQCGSTAGSIFGRITVRDLYSAILVGDRRLFESLVDELAGLFIRHGVECIVGGAAEGHNSGHDICRCVIDAAAARINRGGKAIANFAFPLVGSPDTPPAFARRPGLGLALDHETLNRKLAAARSYAPLQREVEDQIARHGEDGLAREFLFPSARPFGGDWPGDDIRYEQYGAQQVAAGRYNRVIRYRDHVRPLAAAMHAHAARSRLWAACAS